MLIGLHKIIPPNLVLYGPENKNIPDFICYLTHFKCSSLYGKTSVDDLI